MEDTKCSNCGEEMEGVICECFSHDGKFCEPCSDCSVHAPNG